jgi:hypothetical protein
MKSKCTLLLFIFILLCSSSLYSQSKKINSNLGNVDINSTVSKNVPTFLSNSVNSETSNQDNIDAYLIESFESTTFPPEGWQRISVQGANVWSRSTTEAHTGAASAYMAYQSTVGQDWLITPKRPIFTGDSLIFWLKLDYQGYQPDSLSIKVSTTDSNITSFTTTILGLREGTNYPPDDDNWYRYAVGLNDYAGQSIFIAFKHFNADGDGLYIDDVEIGTLPPNNVAAISIDNANGYGPVKIAPLLTVRNVGTATQTFDVTIIASPGGYSSTKTVTSITSGSSAQVEFDSLDLSVTGTYQLTAYTQLATDEDRSNDTVRKTITSYDSFAFNNTPWTAGPPMPSARWGNGCVFYEFQDTAYVYTITGYDGAFANTAVNQRLNLVTGVWDEIAPIPVSRGQVSAIAVQNKIFVPGGYTGSFAPTNRLDIYDIPTNTWTVGANLPQQVGDYAIAIYGDSLIYVVGGYSGAADLNMVQIYNINTNTWITGTAKTGTAVSGIRGGIVDNKIIVAGGYSQTLARSLDEVVIGTIDTVDPSIISWSAGPSYPGGTVGRHGSGVPAVTGTETLDQISPRYVVFTGGDPNGQGTTTLNSTWAYDFMDSEWKIGPNKINGVSNISQVPGVLLNDTVYMYSMGGYNGVSILTAVEYQNLGAEAQLPVELASFTSAVNKNNVMLNWSTVNELNNDKFIIERKNNSVWISVGEVAGSGTTNESKNYSFADRNLPSGFYSYRLKQMDYNGNFEYHNLRGEVVIGVPGTFEMSQNYPNPFNPSTKINFALPFDSKVSLKIYDMLGREAAVIINNETRTAGYHTVQFNGSALSSGIYFYAIRTEGQQNFSLTRKMVLVK